jgi:hypothetical protein
MEDVLVIADHCGLGRNSVRRTPEGVKYWGWEGLVLLLLKISFPRMLQELNTVCGLSVGAVSSIISQTRDAIYDVAKPRMKINFRYV